MSSCTSLSDARLLLLDREGTVLAPPRDLYVLGWEDVRLQPQAAETIALTAHRGFVPVLVTNQSCVGRGLTTQAWVDEVNAWIAERVREAGGGELRALSCPHTDADDCPCRKPRPGMLMDASRITGLPLATAWYVGDQLIDLAAARAAGVKRYFHVGTSGDLCDAVDVECLGGFAELTGHLP